jgi:thiamine biosynthesis lipoprotein
MSTKPFSRRQSLAALVGACVMQPAAAGPLLHATRPLFGSPAEMLLTRDAEPLTAAVVRSDGDERTLECLARLGAVELGPAEGRSVKVDPSLRALIDGAARLEVLSDGLFNAGLGGLVQAWGFHDDVLAPGPRPAPTRWPAGGNRAQPGPAVARLTCAARTRRCSWTPAVTPRVWR